MNRSVVAGWRLLGRELAVRRKPLFAALAWTLLQAAPAMLNGLFLASAIDRGFLSNDLLTGIGWLMAIALVSIVASFAQWRTFPYLAAVIEPLRDSLTRLVVTGTLDHAARSQKDADEAGAARITGQVETVRNVVSALLRSANQLGLSLIAAVTGLAALAPAILLVVIPCLLVALVLFGLIVRRVFARRQALILAHEDLASTANNVFSGARDIAAMRAHGRALAEIEHSINSAARASRILTITNLSNSLVMLIGGHLPVFIVLLAAPVLFGDGRLEAGLVLGTITYLRSQLMGGLGSMMGLVSGWGLQLGATLQRIDDVCQQPSVQEPVEEATPVGHRMRITSLKFTHGIGATPVLENFDLTVDEDDHLAIVGASGIGKSTLANLLTGLLQPQLGTIELGGAKLSEITESHLRRLVALIPQESYVFDGTVRDNLTYITPEATDADLERTVEALGMQSLVERLGGYGGTFTVGDIGLSQGERQLISLARVHLSAASVVILDEATSHLDSATEAIVEAAFARRPGTLIVIAHRISSALRAQRILLFDGNQVYTSTHQELLTRSAQYADLVGRWQDNKQSVDPLQAGTPDAITGVAWCPGTT
jgi:ABC-type multidrug transport system fused ATPase/permease subunit